MPHATHNMQRTTCNTLAPNHTREDALFLRDVHELGCGGKDALRSERRRRRRNAEVGPRRSEEDVSLAFGTAASVDAVFANALRWQANAPEQTEHARMHQSSIAPIDRTASIGVTVSVKKRGKARSATGRSEVAANRVERPAKRGSTTSERRAIGATKEGELVAAIQRQRLCKVRPICAEVGNGCARTLTPPTRHRTKTRQRSKLIRRSGIASSSAWLAALVAATRQ